MSLDEIEIDFVDSFPSSNTRPKIMEGYKRHRAEISALCAFYEQFINGSFVSTKNDPGDIDLVSFADAQEIDNLSDEQKRQFRALFSGPDTKDTHLCDSYFVPTFPENHPYFDECRSLRKYWMGEFGYDRLDRPKGIVKTEVYATVNEDQEDG